jgi:predicted RNA-binding Zn-ribbon protein involved in translation (DUF1610 family)
MATAPGSTLAVWSCRRSGALRCAGRVPSRAPPRPSPSAERRTAATGAARVRTWRSSRSRSRARPPAVISVWSALRRWPMGARSPIPASSVFRVAERALRRAQRRVARRKQGSHRRRTAVHLLAKAPQQLRRQRRDFHHKTALALVREYDTLSHEHVQPATLLKHHQRAKSISAAGWSAFVSILSCTAGAAGTTVVAVPAAYTSQACSGCGVLVHNGVSVRWHACPECGTSLHRDQNAARNSLRLGTERRGAGQALQASTWPAGVSVA